MVLWDWFLGRVSKKKHEASHEYVLESMGNKVMGAVMGFG